MDYSIYPVVKSEVEGELAIDLRGRKHIDRSGNADAVYLTQEETCTSHVVFTMPGQHSADVLRTFLEGQLHPNSIQDEFGIIVPIAEIANSHLPSLQAQLWYESRGTHDTTSYLSVGTATQLQSNVFCTQNQAFGMPLAVQDPYSFHIKRIADLFDGE